jgi:hypothetical protein
MAVGTKKCCKIGEKKKRSQANYKFEIGDTTMLPDSITPARIIPRLLCLIVRRRFTPLGGIDKSLYNKVAFVGLERVTGIEPAWPVWKTGTLPLSYTRSLHGYYRATAPCQSAPARCFTRTFAFRVRRVFKFHNYKTTP